MIQNKMKKLRSNRDRRFQPLKLIQTVHQTAIQHSAFYQIVTVPLMVLVFLVTSNPNKYHR